MKERYPKARSGITQPENDNDEVFLYTIKFLCHLFGEIS